MGIFLLDTCAKFYNDKILSVLWNDSLPFGGIVLPFFKLRKQVLSWNFLHI
jgi:hypothetical protein